ncbi:unnamed protein product, partial [Effrenium voratum]
ACEDWQSLGHSAELLSLMGSPLEDHESTCAELLAELAPEAAWHGTPMLRALAQ